RGRLLACLRLVTPRVYQETTKTHQSPVASRENGRTVRSLSGPRAASWLVAPMNARLAEPIPDANLHWQWDGFLPRSYLFSLDALDRKPPYLREIPVPSGHLFISPDYD